MTTALSLLFVVSVLTHVMLAHANVFQHVAGSQESPSIPTVELKNAAVSGVQMPATGLGTGSYGRYYKNDSEVSQAVFNWIRLGGRRIDASLSYKDQIPVAAGIAQASVPREKLFITSKVGPNLPLGYQDTMSQFADILITLNTTYVDLLLIHWPGPSDNSTDPSCSGPRSSPRLCRQSTWKALEQIFNDGGARAIGVSNFEANHLQDILDLKSLVPSVNQVEFHPYWHEDELVKLCKQHNILFNGYSPLGAPDVSVPRNNWSLLKDASLQKLGKKYSATAAQVMLAWEWQQGIVVNPRTKDVGHMQENLSFFNVTLSDEDMQAISKLKAPNDKPKVDTDPHQIP